MTTIKFENLPVIRSATHPTNQKMLDDLLTKTEMTDDDCKMLDGILNNYEDR